MMRRARIQQDETELQRMAKKRSWKKRECGRGELAEENVDKAGGLYTGCVEEREEEVRMKMNMMMMKTKTKDMIVKKAR